jgi:WD40 repeat protein
MTHMSKERYDLFISHNSLDKSLIDPIVQRLYGEFEIRPWLDKWDIPAATDWSSEIESALQECSACAVFLGANGWGPHHLDEAKLAFRRKEQRPDFKVIPVLLPGAGAKDINLLEDLFKRRHRVDFTNDINDEDAFRRLLSAIQGQAPGPPEETVFTIRRDAKRWEEARAKNKGSFLYKGGQLEQAQGLAQRHTEQLNDLAVKFLNASAVEEQRRIRLERRRTRTVITGLIIASALILLSAVFAFAQRAEAINQAKVAEDRRREAVRQTELAEKRRREADDALKGEQIATNEARHATKQEKIAKEQAEEKRREAEEASRRERAARVEAETQRRGAQARQLFAEAELAQIAAEGNSGRWAELGRHSFQLATAADTLAREVNLAQTAPLDRSVRAVARFLPRSVVEPTLDQAADCVDYTADGRLMILSIGEELSVRETYSGKEIGRLPAIAYQAPNSWTPTLSYLAAKDSDAKYFRVWRVGEKVEELEGLRQRPDVTASAINSEGTLLATAGDDNVLRVVRIPDGSELITETHPGEIKAIATDAAGFLVATACDDDNIRIYDLQRRQLKSIISTKTEKKPDDDSTETEMESDGLAAKYLALSPDGTLLAASDYITIVIWNLVTGTEIRRFRVLPDAEDEGIEFLSFGAGARSVSVYTNKGYAATYDIGTGTQIWPTYTSSDWWTEDQKGVDWWSYFSSAAFRRIPGGIEVWDSSNGSLLTRAAYEGDIATAAYNPLTKTVAVKEGQKLLLISTYPGTDIAGGLLRGEVELLTGSDYGETFAVRTDAAFGIWNWAMPLWWTPVRGLQKVAGVAVSGDGSHVAAWSEEGLKQWSVDRVSGEVKPEAGLRFGPQETALPEKPGRGAWEVSLAYSSGGRYLSALANGRWYVWDAATGRQVLSGGSEQYADAMSVDSDERAAWYVTSGSEGAALWSQPLTLAAERVAPPRRVMGLPSRFSRFSPGGRYVIYRIPRGGPENDKVVIWDLREQKQALEVDSDNLQFSTGDGFVAVINQGSSTASATPSLVSIYDPESERLLARVKHERPVEVIAFSGDGAVVATVDKVRAEDVAQIHITNLRTGKAVVVIPFTGEVYGVALSHEGRRLCVYGRTGVTHVWDISVPKIPVEIAQLQHDTRVRWAAFDRAADHLMTVEGNINTTKTHKWVISTDELLLRIRRHLTRGMDAQPQVPGQGGAACHQRGGSALQK